MIGRLLIAFVGGLVAFVGLEIFHVPYPLPLAILIGLFDLIPLIGHPIGAAAAVVVAVATKGLWPATVLLAVFFLVYQQAENYLIAPRILRHSVDISAVAVLLAALVGATVLAIPVAAAVKVVLAQQIAEHEATATPPRPHHQRFRLRSRPEAQDPPP
jgi:predicted PurR-regulated permease PerM